MSRFDLQVLDRDVRDHLFVPLRLVAAWEVPSDVMMQIIPVKGMLRLCKHELPPQCCNV